MNAADQTYYVYSEVWGTDALGTLVPVAWMGGMTDVVESSGDAHSHELRMQLDKEWLARAGAAAPFVLRNAYVQVWRDRGNVLVFAICLVLQVTFLYPVCLAYHLI